MISFEDVKIVPFEHKYANYMVKWLNDISTLRIRKTKQFTSMALFEQANTDIDIFIGLANGEQIGFIMGRDMSNISHCIELFSYADPRFLDKEEKMIRCAASLYFQERWKNKIVAEVVSSDLNYIKVLEKIGFRPEVRKRQHYFLSGKFHHTIEYGILAGEWFDGKKPGNAESRN